MSDQRLWRKVIFLGFLFFGFELFSQDFWEAQKDPLKRDLFLKNLSDEERIGQVFLMSYLGSRPPVRIMEWVIQKSLGGIKIFGWNVKNADSLSQDIHHLQTQAASVKKAIPLFIATDQEGGHVQHIRDPKLSSSVGNLGLSAIRSPQEAYKTAYHIGQELRSLGVNMNFAPTVDLYTNPDNFITGPRSFSRDPRKTALFSLAFYKGLKEAGVIATAKHFPGHGESYEDSHSALPRITLSQEELWDRELLPYRLLITEDIPAIMSGHLLYPKIDQQMSSASRVFLETLLRKKMQFKGITITDDLLMHPILEKGLDRFVDHAEESFRAGNDILMISLNQTLSEAIRQRFLTLMRQDLSFRQRVDEAVERILRVKWNYFQKEQTLFPSVFDEVALEEGRQFFQQNTLRSLTWLKDSPSVPDTTVSTLLVTTQKAMADEAVQFFPQLEVFYYPYEPVKTPLLEVQNSLIRKVEGYRQIIFHTSTWASGVYLRSLEIMPNDTKVYVISSLSPLYALQSSRVTKAIAVYGNHPLALRAGLWALFSLVQPRGQLPWLP